MQVPWFAGGVQLGSKEGGLVERDLILKSYASGGSVSESKEPVRNMDGTRAVTADLKRAGVHGGGGGGGGGEAQ